MSNYNKLLNNLDNLKLFKIKENIDTYINLINEKQKDIVDSFYELTNLELSFKRERAINSLVKMAGFPYHKTLEDFNFDFQPSINKDKIIDLKNLRFLENKENILFVGSPGVGKTHLATSIGIEAASNRYSTYFISCHDLVTNLKKANYENRLPEKLKNYEKYSLLIIDEVGYLPIDKEGGNLLFQLINKRYEKHSTIITTNITFGKWGELFGDIMIANAILDRLIHHSTIFNITGKSYRIKDKVSSDSEEDLQYKNVGIPT